MFEQLIDKIKRKLLDIKNAIIKKIYNVGDFLKHVASYPVKILVFFLKILFFPIFFVQDVFTGKKKIQSEEKIFRADSVNAAMHEASQVTLVATALGVGLIVVALIWAANAKLDEIVRGIGTVIPSSRLQVVQNLEGGIVQRIYVREGDIVSKDQELLQLNDIHFKSKYQENQQSYYSELAKVVRLRAEADNKKLIFPSVLRKFTHFANREKEVYDSRKKVVDSELSVAREELLKVDQEIRAAKSNLTHLKESYRLIKEEHDLTAPMVEAGAISKVQLLRLNQKISDLSSQISEVEFSIPKLMASRKQANSKIKEVGFQFQESVLEELKASELKLAQLKEGHSSLKDRFRRTMVVSPVNGTVQKVHVNTIGGVVDPGMDLVEIVPANDFLLVEVKVPAKDIAFIRKGLKATVRFTAYDFSIYGGLSGEITRVSADAVSDEQGNYFYLASVKTDKNYFMKKEKSLPIISGMQAEVDIITGKKTVMDYLFKPVIKATTLAMTER